MKKYIILILAITFSLSSCVTDSEPDKVFPECYLSLNDGSYFPIFDHVIENDVLTFINLEGIQVSIEMSEVRRINCGPFKAIED